MRIIDVSASEFAKLRTLPLTTITIAVTALGAAAIGYGIAESARTHGSAASASALVAATVPYVQAGMILLGIIPVTHEHAGGQFRTTLTATPHRGLLLAAKSLVLLVIALATAVTATGATLVAVLAVQHPPAGMEPGATDAWPVIGAVVYLTLIAMLAHAIALLVRHLVPALVVTLVVVLIVPPLLSGLAGFARWLPDRAGSLLYLGASDDVLTPVTGGLVLLGWVLVVGGAASALFLRRDA